MRPSLKLLKAQQEFLHPPQGVDRDIKLYQGGFGSGKTWIGALNGIILSQLYPGNRGLVCALTYPLVRDTTLQAYLDFLDLFNLRKGIDYTFKIAESKMIFHCFGNSEILFRHLQDPNRIKSLNLGWAHIEEMSMITESAFNVLLSRLRLTSVPFYTLFGTTNPPPNKGWMYDYFVKKAGIRDRISYRRVIAPTTENYHLSDTYVANLKNQYDEEYYNINVLGQDGDYTKGLVVKGFSESNIQNTIYEPNKTLYLTCDFNVDPMCWAVVQEFNHEWHFIDEIVMENTTTSEAAREFFKRYRKHQGPIKITGDASGQNRSTQAFDPLENNYTIIRNTLSGLGMSNVSLDLPRSNPEVINRIEVWNSFIKTHLGVVRIKIDPKCKWLIWNCENLMFVEGSDRLFKPTPKEIRDNRNAKFLTHIWDAASYLIYRYHPIRNETIKKEAGGFYDQPYKPN